MCQIGLRMSAEIARRKISTVVLWQLWLGLMIMSNCYADGVGYYGVKDIQVQNSQLLVTHHHDWSDKTRDERYRMISTYQDPFRSDNDYAYIRCTDKVTGHVLFQKPTPALSYLWISPDSQYIIGLSDIKVWNPDQLVVFDRSGRLLMKMHISAEEAALTLNQDHDFQRYYPKLAKVAQAWSTRDKNQVFIDFEGMIESLDAPPTLGKAGWNYLIQHRHASHLSPNFNESVTNWIGWFDEKHPDLRLNIVDGKPISLTLRDPKGKPFMIPFGSAQT